MSVNAIKILGEFAEELRCRLRSNEEDLSIYRRMIERTKTQCDSLRFEISEIEKAIGELIPRDYDGDPI